MVSALVAARSAEKTAAGSAPPPRRLVSASLPSISVRSLGLKVPTPSAGMAVPKGDLATGMAARRA